MKDAMKAPKDLGVGHGTDGSIPEEEGGRVPNMPAKDANSRPPQVMGRNEPVNR